MQVKEEEQKYNHDDKTKTNCLQLKKQDLHLEEDT